MSNGGKLVVDIDVTGDTSKLVKDVDKGIKEMSNKKIDIAIGAVNGVGIDKVTKSISKQGKEAISTQKSLDGYVKTVSNLNKETGKQATKQTLDVVGHQKDLMKKYKDNTGELLRANQEYQKAVNNNESKEYQSLLKSRVDTLQQERTALKENAKEAVNYANANKGVFGLQDKDIKNIEKSYGNKFADYDKRYDQSRLLDSSKLMSKKALADTQNVMKAYENTIKARNKLERDILSTKDVDAKATKQGMLAGMNKDVETASASLDKIKGSLSEVQQASLKAFDTKQTQQMQKAYIDYGASMQKSISSVSKEMMSIGKSGGISKELSGEIDSVLRKANELSTKKIGVNASTTELKTLGAEVDALKQKAENIKLKVQGEQEVRGQINNIANNLESQLTGLKSSFGKGGFFPSSEAKQFQSELNAIRNSTSLDEAKVKADRLGGAMAEAGNKAKVAQSQFSSLNVPFFKDLTNSLKTFGMGYMITSGIRKGLRESLNTIKDMDAAMVDMAKVAKGFSNTSEAKADVRNMALEVSTQVARSSEEVIYGMGSAFRSGLANNMEEALEVSKKAAILANVSNVGQEVADKYITSIINSFGKREIVLDEFEIQIPSDAPEGAFTGLENNIKNYTKKYGETYTELDNLMDLMNYAG